MLPKNLNYITVIVYRNTHADWLILELVHFQLTSLFGLVEYI